MGAPVWEASGSRFSGSADDVERETRCAARAEHDPRSPRGLYRPILERVHVQPPLLYAAHEFALHHGGLDLLARQHALLVRRSAILAGLLEAPVRLEAANP
jgi:hypothetical protein